MIKLCITAIIFFVLAWWGRGRWEKFWEGNCISDEKEWQELRNALDAEKGLKRKAD